MTDQGNQNKKTGQHGTGSQGTREREERITGSVGVQNKKGETIDQGSTTGAKGGSGTGSSSQGNVERSYMGGSQGQGSERNPNTQNMSGSQPMRGGGQHEMPGKKMGGQQNVGGRQQGGVQGSLEEGQHGAGVVEGDRQGNLGGQQGNVRGERTSRTENEGQGSRAGGQSTRAQNQPFVDEDQG